jgi:hypothetical protein
MTSQLEITAKKILEKMDVGNFQQVNSYLGVLENCCNIVEESYKRLKKVYNGVEKKHTAIWLVEPVMEKLKEQGLLTEHLENKINEQLAVNSVEDTIDDIIVSWHERMEKFRTCCFKFKKITKLVSTQLTKLEKIKIE